MKPHDSSTAGGTSDHVASRGIVPLADQRRIAFRGERALLAAILQDAVESYCRTLGSTRRRDRTLHRETEDWIFSDDRSWWLSFTTICDVLEMDADGLRQTLRRRKPGRFRSAATVATRPRTPRFPEALVPGKSSDEVRRSSTGRC